MTRKSKSIKEGRWLQVLLLVIIAGWFFSHFPFLYADADVELSGSRGPLTDEGLYTSTLRNYINYGFLELYGSDGFVKSPGFNFLVFIPFKIFGISHANARGIILVMSLLLLFWFSFSEYFRQLLLLFIPVGLMKFQLHQFGHLCLAEILVSFSVMASLYAYYHYKMAEKTNPWILVTAVAFLFIAFLLKIQYVYLLGIVPILCFIHWLKAPLKRERFYPVLVCGAALAVFILLFLVGWFFPFQEGFEYMVTGQSGNFTIDENTYTTIRYIIENIFFAPKNAVFTTIFLISLVVGGYLVFFQKRKGFSILFGFLVCWILLETHKLPMNYLPTRYLVITFFVMGLLISAVAVELVFHQKTESKIQDYLVKGIPLALSLLLFIQNSTHFVRALKNRQYSVYEVQTYLGQFDFEGKAILGNWAPSLYWKKDAKLVPVTLRNWRRVKPLEDFQPAVIIEEPDEGGSNQAYRSNGVDLDAIADSVKQVNVGKWTLNLYWLKINEQ